MNIAIIPRYAELLDDVVFEYDEYTPVKPYGVDRPGFSALQDRLKEGGHNIATIDRFNMEKIDICLFVDVNYYYLSMFLHQDNPPKLVYMMREAPSAVPFNSTPSLLAHRAVFDRILTWNDELAAGRDHIFKYNLPYRHTESRYDERKSFDERTLLTNISSRKYSDHPDELYTARKKLIEFYDRQHPEDFTLYGRGWNDPPSPMEIFRGNFFPDKFGCYGGLVDDKIEAYHKHKFAVCFENMANIAGWITEKIFDCFRAGTVPIYWGANNIDEYVPAETFIDYREFVSPSDLHKHLASMTESEHQEYLDAAQSYLASTDQFTPSSFAEKISNLLLETPDSDKTDIEHLIDNIEERAHLDRMMYDPTAVPKREYVSRWLRLLRANPQLLVEKPQATYFGLRRVLPGELGEIR